MARNAWRTACGSWLLGPRLLHPLRRGYANNFMFVKGSTIRGNVLGNALRNACLLTEEGTRDLRSFFAASQELRVASAITFLRVLRLLTCRLGVVGRTFLALRVLKDGINFTRYRRIICVVAYLGRRAARYQINRCVVHCRGKARIRTRRFLRVFRLLVRERLRLTRGVKCRLLTGRVVIVRHPTHAKFPALNNELNCVVRGDYPT